MKNGFIVSEGPGFEFLDIEVFASKDSAINDAKDAVQEELDSGQGDPIMYVYKLVPVAKIVGKIKIDVTHIMES